MRSQGFTLVEVVVTGLLSTIVAGTVVSVLSTVNSQINAGKIQARMDLIQTGASEQIKASTRKAWGVLAAGEVLAPGAKYEALSTVPGMVKEVILGDKSGNALAKYRIDTLAGGNGMLMEWSAAEAAYVPFALGPETVYVDLAASGFKIDPRRSGMRFRLVPVLGQDTLNTLEESILCRNR